MKPRRGRSRARGGNAAVRLGVGLAIVTVVVIAPQPPEAVAASTAASGASTTATEASVATARAVRTAGARGGTEDAQGQLQERLERAVRLLEEGRVAEALVELEAVASQAPDSPVARYQLGRALAVAGRPAEAVVELEEARRLDPDSGPIHFELARVLLQLDRLEESRRALDVAASTRPGYPPLEFYRAELCYRVGKVGEARRVFLEVADAAPGWSAPLLRAAEVALESGDVEGSVEPLRRAVELAPDDPVVRTRRADALAAAGRQRQALEAYRRAVAAAPDFLPARVRLATLLFDPLQDYEAADRALREVLDRAPWHGSARLQLARVLVFQGRQEEALEQVEEMLERLGEYARRVAGEDRSADPNGASLAARPDVAADAGFWADWWRRRARELRAEILLDLERPAEAEAVARKLLEQAPDNEVAHYTLGSVLARRRESAARDHLRAFKSLRDAREHRERARQLRRLGDLDAARREYDRALQARPGDVDALTGLAATARVSGSPGEAVELLGRARDAGAGDEEWHREWVLALHAAGRLDEARAAWERAGTQGLSLGPEVWRKMRDPTGVCP